MIQRVQSIFLFIAAIFAVGFLVCPGIELNNVVTAGKSHIPLLIIGSLSALISIADIFLFNNRILQMNVGKLNLVLLVVLVGLSAWTEYGDGDFQPGVGIFLPFVAYIFNWLALRYIRKDEDLVRSTDRLR